MATGTLEGTTIAATYKSLLKVKGGAQELLTSTPKQIEDGHGTDSALWLATTSVLIGGSGTRLDFNTTGSGEYISGNGTALTLNSGEDINLTCATGGDVNIPVNIGLRFGDGNQHIETDNTDLTITSDVGININSPKVDLIQDTNFVTSGNINGMSIDGTTFSVDGTNNRIGIGTAAPATTLEIKATTATLRINGNGNNTDDHPYAFPEFPTQEVASSTIYTPSLESRSVT